MQRHTERSSDSRKAVWAVALTLLLALPAATPALAGRIDRFSNSASEVGLDLRAGAWDNSTTITFPPDCRVKDASVTLRADQSIHQTVIEADRGNVTAWSAKPATFDPRTLDPAALEGTAFTGAELTAVSLNTTASGKTTVSENASAHLFSYDVASVLGGADRDLRTKVVWLGMGTRQGAPPVDEVWLYASDFSRGRWYMWGHISKSPAQGVQELQWEVLLTRGGWTDASGHLFLLAITLPMSQGTGTSLTTSYVEVEVTHTMSPRALEVDIGGDGADEFSWDGPGEGLYGLQGEFADGSGSLSAAVSGHTEHRNVTSFLVPSGARVEGAELTVAGIAGEVTDAASGSGALVPAQGISAGTNVTGIANYSEPVWGQVVLSGLKNAGMEDQKQTSLSGSQSVGNLGSGYQSVAQTFKSSVPGRLIYLNLSLVGSTYINAPNITVEIRDTNSTGHPTDVIIGSSIMNGSNVDFPAPKWYLVPFSGVPIIVGHQYAIVLSAPTATSGQTYEWKNRFLVSGDPYLYGSSLVTDTSDGSGPWGNLSNTDQAFITYMETDITPTEMAQVKVAGEPFSAIIDDGSLGREYVYNITPVFKDAFGVWTFSITNGNDFPILANWSATVHSDVCPQGFGISLSTPAGDASYWSLAGDPIGLSTMWRLSFKEGLTSIIDGAPVAYTSPSGVAFVRVNVTVVGNVTGAILLEGLRVRYALDVPITGPTVVAAAEAYRVAHSTEDQIVLPIAVRSACAARVLLGDPLIKYDLRPFFVTTTQTLDEDSTRTVDLNTLFSDDIDFNNLRFEVLSVSQPANLTATMDGANLTLAPSHDWNGELDVVVRGIDTSDLSRDGTIHVIVNAVNDVPVIALPAEFKVQARSTEVINLSTMIHDVDSLPSSLVLEVNSSFVIVSRTELSVRFDDEGIYRVNLTVVDGADKAYGVIVFNVSAAAGWPSISTSLPNPMSIPVNRHLAIDLLPFGSDQQDTPDKLKWSLRANSTLYTATINASGHWLLIEPAGAGLGQGIVFLTLTDTAGHMVSVEVTVRVVERLLEPPLIDTTRLPAKVNLVKGGDPFVLDLRDYVTDDTPIASLLVKVVYTTKDVAYVDNQSGKLSFVPQAVGKTRATVTLTDSDGLSDAFSIDVEVKEKGKDKEINWWLWVVLLVILAAIITVVAWPRRPASATATAAVTPAGAHATKAPSPMPVAEAPPRKVDKVRPHVFHASTLPQLEEVLLFHRDGKLISQHSRRLREGVDAEIEAGVISAIQDHLKGRMRARDEPADLIELEGMRVVIERGADLAIAAMLTGKEPETLRVLMRRTLHEVQTRNDSVLDGWSGDIGSLRGVDNAMVGLVESLIREEGGTENRAEEAPAAPPPMRELPVRPATRAPSWGEPPEGPEEGAPPPPLEQREQLRLVKGIIGEDRAQELVEGKPKPPHVEGGKDDALVKDMLDREKEREAGEDA